MHFEVQWVYANSVILALLLLTSLGIGSFINVVIHRLPLMQNENHSATIAPFHLGWPRSQCPHCQHPLSVSDIIPLLSFFLLKGKCRHCQHPIDWLYPSIELVTGMLAFISVQCWGLSLQSLTAFAFLAYLLSLSVVDVKYFIIPDSLSLGLLWLGLSVNLAFGYFAHLNNAVLGAILGYLILWLIYQGHRCLTGRIGMGYGDFKLLAAIGAWLGWQALSNVLIIASLSGLAAGLLNMYYHNKSWHRPLPFGPFLSLGAASVLCLGFY